MRPRASKVIAVCRSKRSSSSMTKSASAKALAGSPFSMAKSKAILSPSESVDHRRAGRDGLELVADGRQGLPFDGDKLGGILGLRAAVRRNQRDGLALPDRDVGGEQRLRRLNDGRAGAAPRRQTARSAG